MRVPAVGNNTGELSRAVGYVSENREGPDRHSVRFTRTDPECNMANQSLTGISRMNIPQVYVKCLLV